MLRLTFIRGCLSVKSLACSPSPKHFHVSFASSCSSWGSRKSTGKVETLVDRLTERELRMATQDSEVAIEAVLAPLRASVKEQVRSRYYFFTSCNLVSMVLPHLSIHAGVARLQRTLTASEITREIFSFL